MTAVLQALDLTKTFGAVKALDGFTLEIPEGGVFGVLGPNGAGKSTLFRIWLGLVRPTDGRALVRGEPAGKPRRIGSMIETPRFPPFLTAVQTLQMLALAGGVRLTDADVLARLERVGLAEAAQRNVRGFSVGMMQRLGVAAALLGDPPLIILDEPTSGMDPAGIQEMRAFIRSLADRDGVTVVLASHQLAEVQKVCDRVAIIDHGRLAAQGRVADLVAGQERLRIAATPLDAVLEVLGARGARDGDGVLAD
ncbi:ABC transporter ATP-binding protein, partial [Caulobacter sp. 17J65-9]|uniref:ATP-binding cassette domain-containing protein n=1 Tax=Caulobacter sp. 17J65-9 TaxID=2709382 RepID=UPI0013C790FD|nr:ABC transporter ATP-binding protein [Caulobacter sp. 17J65-9]